MPDLDEELIARAVRWCADAGRQASPDQLRSALRPLSWDQLIAVRAWLADPPPARPLGPWALADLGRGTLPDVAAERERGGQYGRDEAVAPSPDVPTATPRDRPRAARPARGRKPTAPVIHRARDRVVGEAAPRVDPRASLDALFESEGRTVLERLVRRHGARRALVLRALAAGWRTPGGADPSSPDLDRLLQEHGLSRAFERREHDELLHALRAAHGVLAAAAKAVGASVDEFVASLERLGARAEAEAIREVHRADVRRRATLSERVRMLLTDDARLADLGIVGEVEDDLRARLPEHLRALRASGVSPLATALTQTLAMAPRELPLLLTRLGLHLDLTAAVPPGSGGRGAARGGPDRASSRTPSGPRFGGRGPDRSPSGTRGGGVGRRRPGSSGTRPFSSGTRPPSSGTRPVSSGTRAGSSATRPASSSGTRRSSSPGTRSSGRPGTPHRPSAPRGRGRGPRPR